MKNFWFSSLAVCSALLLCGGVYAVDNYTMAIAGPGDVSGPSGSTQSATCTVQLTHAAADPAAPIGAQGWSMSVEPANASITGVSTDLPFKSDPNQFNGGFDKTFLAPPELNGGRSGATSAIVLCFGCPNTLPFEATSDILTLSVDVPVGDEASTAELNFVDDLISQGQPVKTVVTEAGKSIVPEKVGKVINVAPPPPSCCNPGEFNFGWSDARVQNDSATGEGLIGYNDDGLCGGAASVARTGDFEIYANAVSNMGENNIQGWSLSIEQLGGIDVIDVATDGTAAAPLADGGFLNGGFNKTFLANVADSGGRDGATSAIVICFGCPDTLPAVGTESILRLTVGKADPAAETADGTLELNDGLVGQGQPVKNVFTVAGKSVPPCNQSTAILSVSIAPPQGDTFIRGDGNDDGKVNIADPIWIISELFRNGPSSPCQRAADANDDLSVDLADATYLINYRFLGGPEPAAPFPGCDTIDAVEGISCEASSCP